MTGPFRADRIEAHRAYSTTEAAAFLGVHPRTARKMAAAGEFGNGGAFEVRTAGKANRIHAYQIIGWAIEAHRKRNAIRAA